MTLNCWQCLLPPLSAAAAAATGSTCRRDLFQIGFFGSEKVFLIPQQRKNSPFYPAHTQRIYSFNSKMIIAEWNFLSFFGNEETFSPQRQQQQQQHERGAIKEIYYLQFSSARAEYKTQFISAHIRQA
jgi:hypothetical protein